MYKLLLLSNITFLWSSEPLISKFSNDVPLPPTLSQSSETQPQSQTNYDHLFTITRKKMDQEFQEAINSADPEKMSLIMTLITYDPYIKLLNDVHIYEIIEALLEFNATDLKSTIKFFLSDGSKMIEPPLHRIHDGQHNSLDRAIRTFGRFASNPGQGIPDLESLINFLKKSNLINLYEDSSALQTTLRFLLTANNISVLIEAGKLTAEMGLQEKPIIDKTTTGYTEFNNGKILKFLTEVGFTKAKEAVALIKELDLWDSYKDRIQIINFINITKNMSLDDVRSLITLMQKSRTLSFFSNGESINNLVTLFLKKGYTVTEFESIIKRLDDLNIFDKCKKGKHLLSILDREKNLENTVKRIKELKLWDLCHTGERLASLITFFDKNQDKVFQPTVDFMRKHAVFDKTTSNDPLDDIIDIFHIMLNQENPKDQAKIHRQFQHDTDLSDLKDVEEVHPQARTVQFCIDEMKRLGVWDRYATGQDLTKAIMKLRKKPQQTFESRGQMLGVIGELWNTNKEVNKDKYKISTDE